MYIQSVWVRKQPTGTEKMQSISKSIKEGALAFLNAEYRLLLIFVILASGALYGISTMVETTSWLIVPAFVVGAIFSALAGNIGMRIATEANARTAEAAKTSLPKALKVSFGGGVVMGLGVAGLAVFGLALWFLFLVGQFIDGSDFYTNMTIVLESLAGFSLGAESIALFARVGGGIYTKAALLEKLKPVFLRTILVTQQRLLTMLVTMSETLLVWVLICLAVMSRLYSPLWYWGTI